MKRTSSFSRIGFLVAFWTAGLLLDVSSSALAQPFLALTVGGNAPLAHSSNAEERFFSYLWPVGFDLGARLDFAVTRGLLLGPTVTYRIYPFGGVDQEDLVQIDSRRFVSSSGQPTQQLFFGVGLRVEDPAESHSTVPFLEVRGGFEIERVGKITLQWEDLSHALGLVYSSPWPSEYRHQWTLLAGIGLRTPRSSKFSLQPSLLLHIGGRDRIYALAAIDLLYTVPL